MRILTLDLGAVTGWCCGTPGDGQPDAGVWRLPRAKHGFGAYLAAFENLMMMKCTEYAPAVIAFEQPILPRPMQDEDGNLSLNTNMTTLRRLYSLAGMVELAAHHVGAVCKETPVPTIKKALAGHGRASKAEMEAAFELTNSYWPPGVERSERNHVADAYGLWVLMARMYQPEATLGQLPDTPLFAHR